MFKFFKKSVEALRFETSITYPLSFNPYQERSDVPRNY